MAAILSIYVEAMLSSAYRKQSYFGTGQTIYNLFSSSHKRWELHKTRIGCSLHNIPEARWSARLQCIKPFTSHLRGIQLALQHLLELNSTVKTRNEINGEFILCANVGSLV